MSGFAPKHYQQSVLDSVERYFRNCHVLPSPSLAFTHTTEELWGQGLPYHRIEGFAADMPYFCLRVPTGGGKTWLAAKCAALVNTHLLRSPHGVLLWLVPSKAIRDQTLKQLKDRSSPLHLALAEAGPVTVLDIDDAKSITRATLDTSTVVIVSTVQAFNREEREGLKVYQSSGALMQHFEHLADGQRAQLLHDADGTAPCSLANVLRLRRPFLVVDEAHNNRTDLAFDTLAAFDPSGILELTATPDTQRTPSNVLHSVSAAELKAEQMIKLPILLETEADWQKCLAYAADRREQLQAAADVEHRAGAPLLRPVVLVQAQARRQDRDTLHWERVREELVTNHGIPPQQIVVATGDERGLEAIERDYPLGIVDPACPVRFVITQQALAEGWDCPSAYILCSLAATYSDTAVEQLLGRVLRQPGAKARATEALNRSYAYVMSPDFTATANALRDRLVQGAGFDRQAVAQFVRAGRPEQERLDVGAGTARIVITPVVVPLPNAPSLTGLPRPLRDKLEWDRRAGELTIRQPLTEDEQRQLADRAATPAEAEAIVLAGEASRTTAVELRQSPSERGERLQVPAMALRMQGELALFDDPEVLDYPFDLSGYDAYPREDDLRALGLADKVGGGAIDVADDGRLSVGFIPDLQRDLGFAYVPEHWDATRLAAWLCRNLPDSGVTHGSKWAFVQQWLRALLDHDSADLALANRHKFKLRNLLEQRIRELRREAVAQAYQRVLFGDDQPSRVSVGGEFQIAFDPHSYAPSRDYDERRWGRYDFRHHYYPRIGDFDSREEFECACWLDQQAARGRIRYWVRNLVNRVGASFFLQKAGGRFWPDFICVLPDDTILIVEYKGAQGWTDAQDDRDIGALWAELSDGQCRFVMVRDKNWSMIEATLD